ncbi:MAG: hypothetical protein KC645_06420 [Gemmatimonadetes bacterium]|nr:hypothetical protein [Gemmatimonadota bacterium]
MATTARTRPTKTSRATAGMERLARIARTLGVTTRSLQVSEVPELSATTRGKLLGISGRLVSSGLTLSPSFPRKNDDSLDFSSPLMVVAGQVDWTGSNKPKTGLALFSSKYWQITQPTVQVEFGLIEPGKKHLVELYLTCVQSGTYQFRVIPSPGSHKDISVGSSTKVLTEVIDPHPGYSGSYSVTFMQTNPKSQALSWYFHKVVVTVAG